MPKTQKQMVGSLGEDLAADLLIKDGYTIVARNVHMGRNEIDIIAEDRDFIVFVEVKTRSCLYPEAGDYGISATAVDCAKRTNTVKAARDYLYSHHTEKQPRIDVIEVYLPAGGEASLSPKPIKLNHIRNAFDARGRRTH